MIKKILLVLTILFFLIFLIIFYFVDKIYIKKIIKNLENDLNIKVSLEENHKFNIIPSLSLSTKFSIEKKDRNLYIQGAEFIVEKNYNEENAAFNFNSDNIRINKLIVEDLDSFGEINKYNFKNLLQFIAFPEGYFYYNLNKEEKNSLNFINLIIQRINIPVIYKKFSNLSLSFLNEKSFFTSEIQFDNGLILVNNFETKKNSFDIILSGKINLSNQLINLNIIITDNNEKIISIKILGNLENPNVTILSIDKIININFFMNDLSLLLEGGFENVLKNLVINE